MSPDFTPLRSGFSPHSSGKYDSTQSTRRPPRNFSTTVCEKKKKNMFNGFLINKPQFLQEKRKKEMAEIWRFVNQFHVFDTFVTCTYNDIIICIDNLLNIRIQSFRKHSSVPLNSIDGHI